MVDQTRSDLEILVVSLRSDFERREQLQKQFPETYPSFKFIDAYDFRNVDPGDLPDLPELRGRKISPGLSPPEVGCALSHMKALKIASGRSNKSVLILEDDVIGNDKAVAHLRQAIPQLPDSHFMLCGGQEGLRGRRFLRGKPECGAYRIPNALRRFTARASSYLISPDVANLMLRNQQTILRRADEWFNLLDGEYTMFFLELFSHPVDLSGSHLESTRRSALSLKALKDNGIAYTISTQLIKISLPIISLLSGWKKIPTRTHGKTNQT